MKRANTCGVVLAGIALVSCASKPQIKYPLLPAPGSKEKALDCAALTDLIEKADAIRWSIRDSGVQGPTGKGHDALVAVDILAAMAMLATGVPPFAPIPANSPAYALSKADARIQQLLAIKADKTCPPNNTGRPGVSDLDLLASLKALERGNRDGKIKQKELLATRTTLLDTLRDPASLQPPASAKSASPAN
jgi:hypothetical protein